jgi:hypothetical protein
MNPDPSNLVTTRDALHQLAYFALAPARYRETGRLGLRPSAGGFMTPEFEEKVARVEGDLLILEEQSGVATRTITNIGDACGFLGIPYDPDWFVEFRDPLPPADPGKPLEVDAGVTRQIGDLFLFGARVLRTLGEMADPGDEATEIQLWPEHFDLATELGDEEKRASYGLSPGDVAHPEPYLYVSAWGEIDRSNPYWNDPHFNGSSRTYQEIASAPDASVAAVDFLYRGYRLLDGGVE